MKMAKGSKTAKAIKGKGKVTPVQVAFIVDRYLTDSNFTNAASAFRAEAHHLFSKTKGKEAPKGLMGLTDILDEYITLKEQRMMVDQEKRRVEKALNAIKDVMRAFQSAAAPSPSLLPPNPNGSSFVSPPNPPRSGSPSGKLIHETAPVNYAQRSFLPLEAGEPNKLLTPIPEYLSSSKRKNSQSSSRVPPAPKKSRIQPTITSSIFEGKESSSIAIYVNDNKENMAKLSSGQSTSIDNAMIASPVQGSSIVKNLFNQQPNSQASSSPITPTEAFLSQDDKLTSPENFSLCTNVAGASTNRSVFSSESIVVSPVRQPGYYAVHRSYQVTSPFKSSPNKLGKLDHVKGRLQFGEPDNSTDFEKHVATGSTTSSAGGETPGTCDYDIPDLENFSGDFFSGLLAGIDLDSNEKSPTRETSYNLSDHITESKHSTSNACSETNQALHGSGLSSATRVLSEKEVNIQGCDSTPSLRTARRCIKMEHC